MKKDLAILNLRASSLVIFRQLLSDPVMSRFRDMLFSIEKGENKEEIISAYSAFTALLYEHTPDWSKYVADLVLEDDNFYIRKKATDDHIPKTMEDCLRHELELLEDLSQVTPGAIKNAIGYYHYLPEWEVSPMDLKELYRMRTDRVKVEGYGIFTGSRAFRLDDRGEIVPVRYPDGQRLDQLFGYERQRDLIVKNTEAFLSGQGKSNLLLYGDAGTGKSSTVKAVANAFSGEGLRLVEIKKNQLGFLSPVIEQLSANPLKFILFIDDLSFSGGDDDFASMKAMLEGSIVSGGDNLVIYATSNRRHLVKESLSDRDGDDIHRNDTIQEITSLAARFGQTITFERPQKDEYLMIARRLAEDNGMATDGDFTKEAEAFAVRCGGRTPRAAKQFVELKKMSL